MKNQDVIQWYPGHMAKAGRQIGEKLKLIDIVIEVLDARVPVASRNPDIPKFCAHKKHVILLNKADLGDPAENTKWQEALTEEGAADAVLLFTAYDNRMKQNLVKTLQDLNVKEKRQIKCLLCGIPNVGKSAIINTLVGRRKTQTGNRPGVTKGQQWLTAGDSILLLDTPGILWPKFDDETIGWHLSWIGSIKDTIFDRENMAGELMKFLTRRYPERVEERYGIGIDGCQVFEIFDAIAQSKGLLLKGGEYDYLRTSEMILNDFKNGRLGRITIDTQ